MKVSVNEIRRQYPKRPGTCAISGYIPMDVFNAVEKDLRPEMQAKGYRIHYRGPRKSNGGMFLNQASRTRRCDATHAVIYHK